MLMGPRSRRTSAPATSPPTRPPASLTSASLTSAPLFIAESCSGAGSSRRLWHVGDDVDAFAAKHDRLDEV